MKSILLPLFVTLVATINLHAQTFEWAKSWGADKYDYGTAITVDAQGNVYTTGDFEKTVDFDPGGGVYNLKSNGAWDVFVSKLDAEGNLVWACNLGGLDDDYAYSIAVDAAGNVYTLGSFQDTADFDPGYGDYPLVSAGHADVFVSKLDANGNLLWAARWGGGGDDVGRAIAVSAAGDVYSTGYFEQTVDFDPGPNNFDLTVAGGEDVFVSKLNSSGGLIWAEKLGGIDNERGYDLVLDESDNAYLTGYYYGVADFDPGAGIYNLTSAGGNDVFVCKLNVSGNLDWAESMGGSDNDYGNAVAIDGDGNVYTSGNFTDTADFDPGPGVASFSADDYDIFISKLDNTGDFVWAKTVGGSSWDETHSIAVDAFGNVYATGDFSDTADFDPGPGNNILIADYYDAFVLKLDTSGDFAWAYNTGGTADDDGNAIALGNNQSVYVTGLFESTVDFDPGPGVFTRTSQGIDDVFVQKMSQCVATASTLPVGACGSYTSPSGNHTWTSSGTYLDTISNATGCDSVLTINLTINTVDASVTNNAPTLTANATGAIYQWLDCDNNNAIIPGATNQSYTAAANGNYAVQVTQNGCTDTSACEAVVGLSSDGAALLNSISIFPNPTNGNFVLDMPTGVGDVTIRISNSVGQEVYSQKLKSVNHMDLHFDGPAGFYFVTVQRADEVAQFKLVKE